MIIEPLWFWVILIGALLIFAVSFGIYWERRSFKKTSFLSTAPSNLNLSTFPLHNPNPLIRTDLQGKIIFVNNAGKLLLKHWKIELGSKLTGEIKQITQRVMATQKNEELELTIKEQVFYLNITLVEEQQFLHIYGLDITARKMIETQLNRKIVHDLLTDLPNRNLFQDYVKIEIERNHLPQKIYVLIFNITDFTDIHNVYGDKVADQLLLKVKNILLKNINPGATLGKIDSRDFALLDNTYQNPNQVIDLVKNFLNNFIKPIVIDDKEIYTHISVGIASYPADGTDAPSLLRNAKLAQSRAAIALDGFAFYQLAMQTQILAKRKTLLELHKSLALKQLHVYYQPQYCFNTDKLLGAEALLRWQHPQYGFIPPADFIGLAEEFGLIVPIGEWVLEQVCQAQQRWFALGYHLKIAINLSAAQFNDYDLVKKIQKMLATYQLPAKAIEFEITENVLIKDFENALAIMHLLHEQQIDLSIDDFGIGYSSLSYLKEFPVQKLKIDRSFVQNIEKNPKDIGMLKGIINLGRGLGLKVLVEGVETEFELNLIKKLRADQLQGYYYAKPMSLHDFTHFMQDKSYGFSPKR